MSRAHHPLASRQAGLEPCDRDIAWRGSRHAFSQSRQEWLYLHLVAIAATFNVSAHGRGLHTYQHSLPAIDEVRWSMTFRSFSLIGEEMRGKSVTRHRNDVGYMAISSTGQSVSMAATRRR
jgi:hypothetical protein